MNEVIFDLKVEGIRMTVRSSFMSFTAYVNVPKDLVSEIELNIEPHGGWTYKEKLNKTHVTLGWDYAHGSDELYHRHTNSFSSFINDATEWYDKEVICETFSIVKKILELTSCKP